MKKIVAFTAAVLMLGQPLCYGAGINQDKAQHYGAGVAIDMTEAALFPKWTPLERFLGVCAIAGAKEWYDSRHRDKHTADWKDFTATALGGATGEGCIWLIHKSF